MSRVAPDSWIFCAACGTYSPTEKCLRCKKPTPRKSEPVVVFDIAVQKHDEKALQRDAMKWLLLNGAAGIVWHRTDDRTTCAKGVSDFVFLWRGRYVAAEAKVGKRKTTPEQDRFLLEVSTGGGIAFVFRSVDELKEKLWHVERKPSLPVVSGQ